MSRKKGMRVFDVFLLTQKRHGYDRRVHEWIDLAPAGTRRRARGNRPARDAGKMALRKIGREEKGMIGKRVWLLGALLVLTAGCGDTINGVQFAEPEVRRFRQLLAAQEYEKIYKTAHPDFRAGAPKERVIALFAAINRKLGAFRSAEQINWNINTHNMTTTVVLVYASKYAEGEATETFTIVVDDEKPSLFGYQINSFDMIIK